ncbi:NUDIX domain-containing protein [Streptomyces nitrosporeus]|uniref:NUDIX domain-containing protein n=1 Tax=Streptomyces nitrosporeus TaxID=28894 RepID=A0A5J6FHZ7_9ACTN|nr:NUDIX domain-containing protein [Streptomyces nitrosporeus]QEU75661.1 NUDIX domain-containing protein [Streptomyces nitrosporeus]GGY86978.1 putative MutT/nudix family protein [Streptomyces nitrosporeus]
MTTEAQRPVAAAVVVQGERVLFVRRRVAEGTLSWQFPAGEIEPEETPREAAARETEEETGLLVVPQSVLGQRVHPMTGREIHYIACRPVGGRAVVASADEVAGLAWATYGEIPQYVPYGLFEPVQDYLEGALLP